MSQIHSHQASDFRPRPIGRVGELLRERREHLGIGAREFAEKLNIPSRYLEALEQHRYCDVPSAFTKPWLRSYATALGLTWETLAQTAVRQWEGPQRQCSLPASNKPETEWSLSGASSRRTIALAGLLAGFLYLGVQLSSSLLAPAIMIRGLPDASVTRERQQTFVIESAPNVRGTLNGISFMTDEAGRVAVSLTLSPGMNALLLRAKKAHSRFRVKEYTLLLESS